MRSIRDKRGILGLETVGAVIIMLLILAVIAIAAFLALDSLLNSGAVSTTRLVNNFAGFGNETITLNDTPTQPATVNGLVGITYTNLIVSNATNNTLADTVVTTGNFTVNVDGALTTTGFAPFNGTTVNVSASSFTNTIPSYEVDLVGNVTNGTAEFFANIPTVMVILGAVVIILAVVLIILAVGRISGGARETDLGGGGSSAGPGL